MYLEFVLAPSFNGLADNSSASMNPLKCRFRVRWI